MRILLLSTGGKIGGEETFTRNLALSLLDKGHYVEVAAGGNVQQSDLEKRGIKICPIDITARRPLGLNKAAKKLSKYVNDNNIDVVHAQAIGPAIMGIWAKKYHGCKTPWIWHNHGITDFAYKHIVRHLNGLDCIVANSDYVKESLKGHGVKPEVIVRIHNGINFDDFYVTQTDRENNRHKLVSELGIPGNARCIVYVGRLSPEKGVEVLLRAFDIYGSSHPEVYCVLVGDGTERKRLENQVESSKTASRVKFLGFRSDIKEIVSACDTLVLPSHIETFSLTTLQAFASGTPCIGSDVGGTPEQILDKFSGRMFPDNDEKELCRCLEDIIGNEDRASYYSANAQHLSRNYLNIDRMTDDIITVYKNLIIKNRQNYESCIPYNG